MKKYYVNELKVNDDFQDFFMVKSMLIKTGSNNKDYMDLVLLDCTGEIGAKKWDITEPEAMTLTQAGNGSFVKVRGIVTEWNGFRQIRVTKIRLSQESDDLEIADYIKSAPEPAEEMYNYIMGVADSLSDEDMRNICKKMLTDNKEKLMYYPAASKNHHAEMAGLLYHVKRMLMMAKVTCGVYTNLNEDLLNTGVIIHDMEKLNEIESDEFGVSPGYSTEGQLLGHIVMGVRELEKLCDELNVPREKATVLEHMILSHHYEPDYGSPKKPLFPEAEVLHYLDVLDARMFDMEEGLKTAEPGEFSERVRTLDNRRLYKITFDK